MSFLRDIQTAATDDTTDIAALLRKCLILAVRLRSDELRSWVEKELNGYGDRSELPAYRVLHTESHGTFRNLVQQLNDAIIPPATLPEKYREFATTVWLMAPISSYSSVIHQSEEKQNLVENWPPNLVMLLGGKIYTEMTCFGAWKIISRNAIVGMLDTVRTRVLSFVLQIEGTVADVDDAESHRADTAEQRDVVHQVFHNTFYGDVQNVAAGNAHVEQRAAPIVARGDSAALRTVLKLQGVEDADIEQLLEALKSDANSGMEGQIGPAVQSWMGKLWAATVSGSSKVATSAIGSVIGKAIAIFLGLP